MYERLLGQSGSTYNTPRLQHCCKRVLNPVELEDRPWLSLAINVFIWAVAILGILMSLAYLLGYVDLSSDDHNSGKKNCDALSFTNDVQPYEDQVTYDWRSVSGASCTKYCTNLHNLLPGYSIKFAIWTNVTQMVLQGAVRSLTNRDFYQIVNNVTLTCDKHNHCDIMTTSADNYITLNKKGCDDNLLYDVAPRGVPFFSNDILKSLVGWMKIKT